MSRRERGHSDLTAKIETGDPQGFSNLTAGKQVKKARPDLEGFSMNP